MSLYDGQYLSSCCFLKIGANKPHLCYPCANCCPKSYPLACKYAMNLQGGQYLSRYSLEIKYQYTIRKIHIISFRKICIIRVTASPTLQGWVLGFFVVYYMPITTAIRSFKINKHPKCIKYLQHKPSVLIFTQNSRYSVVGNY